jgi:hypothetical protein
MPIIHHNSISARKPYRVDPRDNVHQKRQNQSKYAHIYNSRQWKYARKATIENTPLCHICEEDGLIVASCTVNHIKPLRTFLDPTLPLNKVSSKHQRLCFGEDNLEALCLKCHGVEEAQQMKLEKLEREKKVETQKEIDRQREQKEILEVRKASNRRVSFRHQIYTDENGEPVHMEIF